MSNTFTEGEAFAPQRSLFNALGFTKEEMRKPLVGIVSSYNEIVPGHMNIDKIVDAVKLGVAMAGGTPVVFPAIAVCDGIAMGHVGMKYSLVTRDLIADSTECMALAHQFDALVMVPNCDKNVPGLLMAAARVNVPTVFVSGGPMLAGRVKGCKTSLSSMFEAVGSYAAGKITKEELDEFENKTCPTCGSCSGMYTANSMNCLTEVLGMGLQGNGTIPAVYSERIRLAKHAGMKVMELLEKNIRPRDILTEKAFENALTVDMALGCSTMFASVKKKGLERNGIVQRDMVFPRSGLHCGEHTVLHAGLGEGLEGSTPIRHIIPNGLPQTQHPLLDQILAVPAHEEQGTGESAHHTGIAADEGFLRRPVSLGGQGAEGLITLFMICGWKSSHTNLLLIPV